MIKIIINMYVNFDRLLILILNIELFDIVYYQYF